MTKVEKNRVIWTDIIKLGNERTQISPKTALGRKMDQYKALLLRMSQDGLIVRTSHMDIHLHHPLHCVMG